MGRLLYIHISRKVQWLGANLARRRDDHWQQSQRRLFVLRGSLVLAGDGSATTDGEPALAGEISAPTDDIPPLSVDRPAKRMVADGVLAGTTSGEGEDEGLSLLE